MMESLVPRTGVARGRRVPMTLLMAVVIGWGVLLVELGVLAWLFLRHNR
jgi:hypothetical protein